MEVIRGVDVNDLYYFGMEALKKRGVVEDTRNGKAVVMPWPVTSIYEKPRQRVLIDIKRAANPFFHLFESLWMLAGRNDVAALNTYIMDFGTRFAEADGNVHGAYGHRWRKALGFDQLEAIVQRLKTNPQDRQAVLQMWDSQVSGIGCQDLLGDWKDRPCNTHVYFRVRSGVLDMLISCRSNDIVYGAYGANAVHFSILQEYVAGRVGVDVGVMTQVSFNYHAYLDVIERMGTPAVVTYDSMGIKPLPMATDWNHWDTDLTTFMEWQKRMLNGQLERMPYTNSWFANTAEPMFHAHHLWRQAMKAEAVNTAKLIEADDWRVAALQWFAIRTNPRSR